MLYLISLVRSFFFIYSILIVIRVVASWFPKLAQSRFMQVINTCTEPYLNLFRRFIPPIGGTLDISVLVAFIALRLLERLCLFLLLWIHSLFV